MNVEFINFINECEKNNIGLFDLVLNDLLIFEKRKERKLVKILGC